MLKKIIVGLSLSLLFIINNSLASNIDGKIVESFFASLEKIKSIKVDFQQVDSTSKTVQGTLLISKPYRFRCNYYEPFPLVIIGGSNYVTVYDYELDQASRISAAENSFNFLLTDTKNFSKSFIIEETGEDSNFMKVKLRHKDFDKTSRIIIQKKTQQIKLIEIFEDNNVIKIELKNQADVTKFDKDLFIIRNTEIYGSPPRYSKAELESKYIIAN